MYAFRLPENTDTCQSARGLPSTTSLLWQAWKSEHNCHSNCQTIAGIYSAALLLSRSLSLLLCHISSAAFVGLYCGCSVITFWWGRALRCNVAALQNTIAKKRPCIFMHLTMKIHRFLFASHYFIKRASDSLGFVHYSWMARRRWRTEKSGAMKWKHNN